MSNNKVRFHVSYGDTGWTIVMITRNGKVIDKTKDIKTDEDMIEQVDYIKSKYPNRDFSIPRMEAEIVIYKRKAKPKEKLKEKPRNA